ncbi:DUF1800 family protein [Chitinimonas sp.]|uniref:DUF1800 domain-containing protein n=1 Tax=Chitinimonas sp. TaxID=1934313 RepID=UPI0035AE27E7
MLPYLLALVMAVSVLASPMGEADARHLLARTGFGVRSEELAQFGRMSRSQAVEQLLAGVQTQAGTPPPAWVNDAPFPKREVANDEAAKQAYREQIREQGIALREWWYQELLETPSPLTEKMTLFWHNHFVSAQQKVKSPQLMYRQNVLLRREGLGNFGRLLHEVARDPAMLEYLDGVKNRRGEPNENFAREVMELFTLGEGHYSEQDIREAARALTGMSLDRDSGDYRFRPALHDFGEKTVFGQRGNFDPDQFLDLLLARPELGEFISAKLWREFVSPEPDPSEIRRLGKLFRDAHYEIKPLMRALLMSDGFWAPNNRGVLVKSPVELAIGSYRSFGLKPPSWKPILGVSRNLGQDLFNPPNVKGWPGYTDWINSQTLLTRKQMLAKLFRISDMAAPPLDPSRVDKELARLGQGSVDFNAETWLASVGGLGRASLLLLPLSMDGMADGSAASSISQMALNPQYQLK